MTSFYNKQSAIVCTGGMLRCTFGGNDPFCSNVISSRSVDSHSSQRNDIQKAPSSSLSSDPDVFHGSNYETQKNHYGSKVCSREVTIEQGTCQLLQKEAHCPNNTDRQEMKIPKKGHSYSDCLEEEHICTELLNENPFLSDFHKDKRFNAHTIPYKFKNRQSWKKNAQSSLIKRDENDNILRLLNLQDYEQQPMSENHNNPFCTDNNGSALNTHKWNAGKTILDDEISSIRKILSDLPCLHNDGLVCFHQDQNDKVNKIECNPFIEDPNLHTATMTSQPPIQAISPETRGMNQSPFQTRLSMNNSPHNFRLHEWIYLEDSFEILPAIL